MRISDDRYTRDRVRMDLALRLIRHEARTFTIREWTGLSDDRIRKSPRQAAFFFRNQEVRFQAANLASLFLLFGLLHTTAKGLESNFRLGSLESGALLCGGYEAYRELHTPAAISFEHAWFLLLALGRHHEVSLARCSTCGGVGLRDLLAKSCSSCVNCGTDLLGAPPQSVA
jgi:hypothetical protein